MFADGGRVDSYVLSVCGCLRVSCVEEEVSRGIGVLGDYVGLRVLEYGAAHYGAKKFYRVDVGGASAYVSWNVSCSGQEGNRWSFLPVIG